MICLDIFDDESTLTCKNCDQLYRLRTGGEPTPFCDVCAQDKVLELQAANERLRALLGRVLDAPVRADTNCFLEVSTLFDEIRAALAAAKG